jgi:hypothetical protein
MFVLFYKSFVFWGFAQKFAFAQPACSKSRIQGSKAGISPTEPTLLPAGKKK